MAGQHLTGWGLPSLRRAVADQWDYEDPSHRRRQPVASNSTPIEQGLITRRLLSSVLLLFTDEGETGVTSPGRGLGRVNEDPGLPSNQDPPLFLAGVVQRIAGRYVRHQLGCSFCQVYSLAFPPPEGIRKAAEPNTNGRGMGAGWSGDNGPRVYTLQDCPALLGTSWVLHQTFPCPRWIALQGCRAPSTRDMLLYPRPNRRNIYPISDQKGIMYTLFQTKKA